MRKILLLLFLGHFGFSQSINAIIGDRSWVASYGEANLSQAKEKDRIKTHLNYVLSLLRANKIESSERERMLKLLETYVDSAVFPQAFSYPSAERRPCFIDDEGRLCAVGFLLSETAGFDEAKRINANFRFHYLMDIEDLALKQWQENSGLSMRELAMVQPAYRSANKFYRYTSKSGLMGLRYSSSNLIAILARYDALHHDRDQNFFWGRNRKGWNIYNSKARRINRQHYDTVFLWSGKEKLNLLTAGKKGTQAFKENGELRFEREGIYPKAIAGSLFIAQKGEGMGVFNWEGEAVTSSPYDLIEAIYSRASVPEVLVLGYNRLAAFKVLKNGFWGIISSTGEPIIEAEWDTIKHERGLYIAKSKALGPRLFKKNGDSLDLKGLQSIEEALCSYCSAVNTANSQGVFNGYSQEWAIEPHKLVTSVNGNAYLIQNEQNKWGLADAHGRLLFACQFDSIAVFEHYAILKDSAQILLGSLRGDTISYGDYSELGLFARSETGQSNNLYYTKAKGELRILNERGEERFQQLDLIDFETTGKSLVLIHRKEGKTLAQFYKDELKLYPYLKVDAIDCIGPSTYLYKSKGKVGIAQKYYGHEIDSSNFKRAIFDSLIPVPGPRDFSLYLAEKNGFWGVYNAKLDSIIIAIDQVDFYPKEIGNSSQWVYFINADAIWKGYFYTSPKLKYLMPAAQKKLSEKYLKTKRED